MGFVRWLYKLWRGIPDHFSVDFETNPIQLPDSDWNRNASLPWDDPNSDPLGDVQEFIKREKERYSNPITPDSPKGPRGPSPDLVIFDEAAALTDRDLMDAEEKAIWADIEGGKTPQPPIVYPPPAEQSTQDWVTEQLQQRTGGITRHPMDLTNYPTPPTEADVAARDYVNADLPAGLTRMALFTHGYSMSYLNELLARANRKDFTLATEDLMALRARGLA